MAPAVYSDGVLLGNVSREAPSVFPVKPGWRTIRLQQFGAGSHTLNISIPECATADLVCDLVIGTRSAWKCEILGDRERILTADAAGIAITLDDEVVTSRTREETVRVPPGAVITVRRSRTLERVQKLEWGHDRPPPDTGVVSAIKNRIIQEISGRRRNGSSGGSVSLAGSETLEYTVQLDGRASPEYRVYWVDKVLSGVATAVVNGELRRIPFEYVESTDLQVETPD